MESNVWDYWQTENSKLSAGTCSALPGGMHTGFLNLSDSKLSNELLKFYLFLSCGHFQTFTYQSISEKNIFLLKVSWKFGKKQWLFCKKYKFWQQMALISQLNPIKWCSLYLELRSLLYMSTNTYVNIMYPYAQSWSGFVLWWVLLWIALKLDHECLYFETCLQL